MSEQIKGAGGAGRAFATFTAAYTAPDAGAGAGAGAGPEGGAGARAKPARVFVVQFRHMKPTTVEADAYFAAFSELLGSHASADAPCAIVFDATALKLSDGVPVAFLKRHESFSRAQVARIESVCTGMGLILPATLASLRPLISAALNAMPKRAQKLKDFATLTDAVQCLARGL